MSEQPPNDDMTPAEWAEKVAEVKQELTDLKRSGEMDFEKARQLNKQLRDLRKKK